MDMYRERLNSTLNIETQGCISTQIMRPSITNKIAGDALLWVIVRSVQLEEKPRMPCGKYTQGSSSQ